jgi:hypothetical protein
MMSFRKLAAGGLAVALLAIPLATMLFLTGCRKLEQLVLDTNLTPDTRVTSSPPPMSDGQPGPTNYRVHLYWDGTDPDGFVVAYHYAWDDTVPPYGAVDSPWQLTTVTDSLFRALIDGGHSQRHTFYVRSVDNEGKLDPTPARVRFEAQTELPEFYYLYRVGGPMDPDQGIPDPSVKDTVLMGLPVTFVWSAWDPDGQGEPVQYSYTLDSTPFSPYGDSTRVTIPHMAAQLHDFYVKAKDETGAVCFPERYRFVMNYEPDSQIIDPPDSTGTLLVADGDTIWFRWVVRDKEQLEGLDGGLSRILIRLDNEPLEFPVDPETGEYTNEWYYTSNVPSTNPHHIAHNNNHQGGNRPHTFEIWARDIEGTFERPSTVPSDRETYVFSYNKPPHTTVLYPEEGGTVVGTAFEALWEGHDDDGEVQAYQFVLDPGVNAYVYCQVGGPYGACTGWEFEDVSPGAHQFWVRSQDNAGCWELSWNKLHFNVVDE